MQQDEVRKLEDACERAIADALRREHPRAVEPKVCHLMAKAAVAVLEAVTETDARTRP